MSDGMVYLETFRAVVFTGFERFDIGPAGSRVDACLLQGRCVLESLHHAR